MKIEGPIWIESRPNEGSLVGTTLYNQFISFNNKEMDYECPHHMAEVMNALLTPQDVRYDRRQRSKFSFRHHRLYSVEFDA